jgi:hypothetical protein
MVVEIVEGEGMAEEKLTSKIYLALVLPKGELNNCVLTDIQYAEPGCASYPSA